MTHGVHSLDYPNGRFIAAEVDLTTGCHTLLNFRSAPHSQCVAHCQALGRISNASKTRHIFLAHKDGANDE